jgi:hypothetical protein
MAYLDDLGSLGAQNRRRGNPGHQRDTTGRFQQTATRKLIMI